MQYLHSLLGTERKHLCTQSGLFRAKGRGASLPRRGLSRPAFRRLEGKLLIGVHDASVLHEAAAHAAIVRRFRIELANWMLSGAATRSMELQARC